MNHEQSVSLGAVERYLLNELAPADRDEFEEHFFGCQECATDVKATAAFLEAARKHLKGSPAAKRSIEHDKAPWYAALWNPKLAAPVFAVMLFVIGFQNFVTLPRDAARITSLSGPEVLSSVSLISGNSRGGSAATVTVQPRQPFLIALDIPASDNSSGYSCELVSQDGKILWQLPVSAQAAKDTVSIRVPPAQWTAGTYSVTVHAISDKVGSTSVEVARYRLDLRTGS